MAAGVVLHPSSPPTPVPAKVDRIAVRARRERGLQGGGTAFDRWIHRADVAITVWSRKPACSRRGRKNAL
jgi:hypothetical protein